MSGTDGDSGRTAFLIEDEPAIAQEVMAAIAADGLEVEHVATGEEGLKAAAAKPYAVLVIDRMLPGLDGLSMLGKLRDLGVQTPALILSAMGETEQRVEGLRGGADDYLAKPFDAEELQARIAVLCRRAVPHPEVILIDDLQIWTVAKRARRAGEDLKLTPKEFDLLAYLARNEGLVVTRRMIQAHVFKLKFDPGTNLVDVHIARLRKQIDAGREEGTKLLKTERGNGYILAKPA